MASGCVFIDFFFNLPPELVLEIALYLDVEDIVNCLLVNRNCYDLLTALEPYWRKACARYGLSGRILEKMECASAKEALFAARKHRLGICATPPEICTLGKGYPFDVRYACQYARNGLIVGTVYKDFIPFEIVVERVERRLIRRTNVFPLIFSRVANNRVVWGHVVSNFLLCVTASGIWSGYDISSDTAVFQWRGPTMYDSDLKFGLCEKCCMVCAGRLITSRSAEQESYWDLRILKIGRDVTEPVERTPCAMKFKLMTGHKNISVRQTNCGMKSLWLLPGSKRQDKEGFCQTHTFLIQWANTVAAHSVVSKADTCVLSVRPEAVFTVPCQRLDLALVRYQGLNSEFRLSLDQELIGMIFQSHLHVWDLKTSEWLSSVEIILEKYNYEQMQLIALGFIYSVIGLEFNNTLMVVVNETGEVILRCSNFAHRHSRLVPPFIEFLCTTAEGWLSDITAHCSLASPAVLFWNKTNRAVEGICFGKPLTPESGDVEAQPSKKRRPWWNRRSNK